MFAIVFAVPDGSSDGTPSPPGSPQALSHGAMSHGASSLSLFASSASDSEPELEALMNAMG